MASQDPFFIVKEEVRHSMSVVETLFGRWKELLDTVQRSGDTNEFDWTTQELQRGFKTIQMDLADLDETNSIVQKNRMKFKIEDAELNERIKFVTDTRQRLADIEASIRNPTTKAVVEKAERERLATRGVESAAAKESDKYAKARADVVRLNDERIGRTFQDQDQIVRQQDEHLDVMSVHIQNIGHMAGDINDELEKQNRALDDLDRDVDETHGRLTEAMTRLVKVIKNSKDTGKIITVFILIGVLAMLLFFLFT